MNKYILIILFLTYYHSIHAQWIEQNSGTIENLNEE